MALRFNGICLITDNLPAMRDFCQEALGIRAEGTDVHVRLLLDGAELAIFSAEGMNRMAPGSLDGTGNGRHTIDIEVPDVDVEYHRLRALNVPIVKLPTTHPWGRRSLWCRDPDGNIVNIYSDTARTDKLV